MDVEKIIESAGPEDYARLQQALFKQAKTYRNVKMGLYVALVVLVLILAAYFVVGG